MVANREEYFEQLLSLFERHIEAKDARAEFEIKEQILNFIQENKDLDLAYDLPNNYNPHA